jgi:hypothetical protein
MMTTASRHAQSWCAKPTTTAATWLALSARKGMPTVFS